MSNWLSGFKGPHLTKWSFIRLRKQQTSTFGILKNVQTRTKVTACSLITIL